MSRADVVIPIYRDVALTRTCVDAVLTHSGGCLDRIWLVDDCSPDPGMAQMLADLRARHAQVRLFRNARNLGFVQTANLGLAASEHDAVILNSDAQVTAGWLDEMLAVFRAHPRVAALSPLSNNAGMCSVPDYGQAFPSSQVPFERLRLGGLPPFTEMPTAHGFCLLLRREALRELGPLDGGYGRGYHEENDWCQRARKAGWRVGRANRAFVFHEGEISFEGERSLLDARNGWRLVGRYPDFFAEMRVFDRSLPARLAARAVRASLGRLHVCSNVPSLAGLWAKEPGLSWSPSPDEDCDVAFVRPGQPSAATPLVVPVLDDADLPAIEAGSLDGLLARSPGVVAASPAASQPLARRFPALRQCPAQAGALEPFLRELVLGPVQSA